MKISIHRLSGEGGLIEGDTSNITPRYEEEGLVFSGFLDCVTPIRIVLSKADERNLKTTINLQTYADMLQSKKPEPDYSGLS